MSRLRGWWLAWRCSPALASGHCTDRVPISTAPLQATPRFQSGVINDYITWLVTGVAALGGILAIIIR